MAIADKPVMKDGETSVPVKTAVPPLRRWDPLDLFGTLQDDLERFWQAGWPFRGRLRLSAPPLPRLTAAWAPRADVYRKDGGLVVKAELPGMTKDSIHVSLEQGDLTISGERRDESEVKEDDYFRCERSYGSFYRRFALPAEVKADQITASYTDGVLEVFVPTPVAEPPKAAQIPVS
ncbi:MAG TPA: Hsp20/alpha crystallin family protein [Chloroflexota bacterium]|nr:Hsp20/alpha crystallin family protein [Chloroflexota bacterium]